VKIFNNTITYRSKTRRLL